METMVGIGLVWGITNAFIKRGALVADQKKKKCLPSSSSSSAKGLRLGLGLIQEIVTFMSVWEYWVPFVLNLCASVAFFLFLGDAPISVAVPVTNAVTFSATAVAGWALGERTQFFCTVAGLCFIVLGICLCMSSS